VTGEEPEWILFRIYLHAKNAWSSLNARMTCKWCYAFVNARFVLCLRGSGLQGVWQDLHGFFGFLEELLTRLCLWVCCVCSEVCCCVFQVFLGSLSCCSRWSSPPDIWTCSLPSSPSTTPSWRWTLWRPIWVTSGDGGQRVIILTLLYNDKIIG